jgi:glutaredoxin
MVTNMGPKITVYGKHGCAKCDAAKSKLEQMGLRFELKDAASVTTAEYWRRFPVESVEVQAEYALHPTLPVIMIDGRAMSYPEAMKTLKGRSVRDEDG